MFDRVDGILCNSCPLMVIVVHDFVLIFRMAYVGYVAYLMCGYHLEAVFPGFPIVF